MIPLLILTCLSAFFRSRYNLALEILALRQQIFWTMLRRLWPAWSHVLVIVKPETVVAWHRAGFRLFWRLRSKPKTPGRPKLDAEVRALIRRMVTENSTWGAPQIHGELLKLGFEVSERTVSRYIRRLSPPEQARKLWATFLRNHREVITAWTSSPCRPSRSESCIVSSSSNTIDARFSISTSRSTQPAPG